MTFQHNSEANTKCSFPIISKVGNTSQISYVLNEAPSTYPVGGVVGGGDGWCCDGGGWCCHQPRVVESSRTALRHVRRVNLPLRSSQNVFVSFCLVTLYMRILLFLLQTRSRHKYHNDGRTSSAR